MTDLGVHVHELVRQVAEGVDGADAPGAQIRIRIEDCDRRALAGIDVGDHDDRWGRAPFAKTSVNTDGKTRWKWPRRAVFEAVASAVRAELGVADDGDIVMELHIEAGAYEFRYEQASPGPSRELAYPDVSLVLDPGHRFPNHPAPVTVPGPAPDTRPTDPQVLATVADLVEQFTALYPQIKGHAAEFEAGYSEEQIAEAEAAMGLRLPEDLRALYRIVHDDHGEHGLLWMHMLDPLDRVVSRYLGTTEDAQWTPEEFNGLGVSVRNGRPFSDDAVVLDSWPADAVRRVAHNAGWVALGDNSSRRRVVVDLDPGPAGTAGQLFEYEFGRDDLTVEVIAESVTALLRHIVDSARAGGLDDDDDDGDPIGDGDPRLLVPGPDPVAGEPMHRDLRITSATELAALPAAEVQKLTVDDCPHFDLTELSQLSRLRVVDIRGGAQTVNLALPHQVPVESLTVRPPVGGRAELDLAGLSGHPTLWDLTITGTTPPVSIAPLTELPALERVDLSGLNVRDLELLATLPNLRILTLDARQWQHLREHNAIPANLAAVRLSGNNPLEVEADWAAGFARAGTAQVMHGRLGRPTPDAK